MNTNAAIKCENISKRYGLHPLLELKEWLRGADYTAEEMNINGPWALRELSFELNKGEVIGIIGRNGAGKSTLLKVIAGVSKCTRGEITTNGKIFSMIELNAGISPELTGRENAKILAAVMGMGRKEIKSNLPLIEEYCELGEWFDMPVRKYSSGMKARLGFSVAMNVNAEILLIDEVLSVGDLSFQRKCYESLNQMRNSGASIIFVSHNIRQIERLCDRVMYLDKGRIIEFGDTAKICQSYYEKNTIDTSHDGKRKLQIPANWHGSGELDILKVEIMDSTGKLTDKITSLNEVRIRVHYIAHDKIIQPNFAISILSSEMIMLGSMTAGYNEIENFYFEGEGWIEAPIPHITLTPGLYSISIVVKSQEGRKMGSGQNMAFFNIEYHPDLKYGNIGAIMHFPRIWKTSDGRYAERLLE